MTDGTSLSASDVALLSGNGFGGFGGGLEGIIYLAIIAFMFGGGFGFGGNGNIDQDINRGFDNQNLQAQTRDILAAVNAGTASTTAAVNQSFHDSLMANQSLYNEVARDIAGLAVGQANMLARQNECCCETKQMIMQNNYDGALRDAATNANFTAQIQGVKDMIAQDRYQALEQKYIDLSRKFDLAGVVRYPTSTVYGVPSPCFAYGGNCV